MDEFEMSDLGELSYFLGIEFVSTSKGIFMHQKKYAEDILKRFNMMECNSIITPTKTGIKLQIDEDKKDVDPTLYKQIVGSLRYLCNTKPDIAYCVGLISRFMEKPKTPHFLEAKRILRYVKGTLDLGILYPYSQKNIEGEVFGYSDWCGDKDDRKSTAGLSSSMARSVNGRTELEKLQSYEDDDDDNTVLHIAAETAKMIRENLD
ncbi:uncharacterized mitochondrial protein AtMg00810-like [Glycine max]|uniref:uncharacterized mitochondrial protein AtMg00810-like n=1 Tax=Glycine max TaxID=3847 RepID=UPI0007190E6D|nr:uncharacterized mitochondrial protein AtMg00810-like [Glycine max]|eukprot:XP_014625989.1 uncharacterized protein LOC106796867 [Glycine max]